VARCVRVKDKDVSTPRGSPTRTRRVPCIGCNHWLQTTYGSVDYLQHTGSVGEDKVAYRNKTYVCFDGDNDIHYYRLMQAWHQNDYTPFQFYNAHEINTARDSSQEASIKNQLRQRLLNSKLFVVLIGSNTRYLTKFVKWEMEQALAMNLPIIGVNLNGQRQQDVQRCPPTIKDELAVYISFNARILQYALEDWPANHASLRAQHKTGPFYYQAQIYTGFGL